MLKKKEKIKIMKKKDISFDTKIIHSGEPDPRIEGAGNVPIFQCSTFEYSDIPKDLKEISDKYRLFLLEEVASYDETLMEKYLNEEDISVYLNQS